MKTDYVVENDVARRRLEALLGAIDGQDLARRLDNGLTVAAVLLHLAFWDDYGTALLGQWRETGYTPTRSNFEAINSAVGHLASVVPVGSIPALVLDAADAVDRQIEALDPGLAAAVEAGGSGRVLHRAVHRTLHLDQIETALATSGDERAGQA